MPNYIPISGQTPESGGFLLPEAQGDMLVNGLLAEAGALDLVGDKRATGVRKEKFGIWLGKPTADFVGEGGRKPVTGGEFGQTEMNVKKIASIPLFTDEMIEDVQSGDLNVLVDSGVREAIADVIDAHIIGQDNGVPITSNFDNNLVQSTTFVEYDQTLADGLERAVSAAMGILEGNGYGNPGNLGVLLGPGFGQVLRDASSAVDPTIRVYAAGRDPLFGLSRFNSTNLSGASTAASASNTVAIVCHRPNLHARIRKDVQVTTSNQATVEVAPGDVRYLWQENLTGFRYETRLAFMAHDLDRAVVKIVNAA